MYAAVIWNIPSHATQPSKWPFTGFATEKIKYIKINTSSLFGLIAACTNIRFLLRTGKYWWFDLICQSNYHEHDTGIVRRIPTHHNFSWLIFCSDFLLGSKHEMARRYFAYSIRWKSRLSKVVRRRGSLSKALGWVRRNEAELCKYSLKHKRDRGPRGSYLFGVVLFSKAGWRCVLVCALKCMNRSSSSWWIDDMATEGVRYRLRWAPLAETTTKELFREICSLYFYRNWSIFQATLVATGLLCENRRREESTRCLHLIKTRKRLSGG